MGTLDNLMLRLDQGLSSLLGQWNAYTTAITTVLVVVVTYQLYSRRDPDTHPLLLARQAQASPVRQAGESAVYRSHSAPHSMPLNSGLNVKEAGASRWARGRDGDLRDVWRQAVAGVQDEGSPESKGARGLILTVLGSEHVIEHSLDDMTRQINLIGQHIQDQGGIRVAIYLPNSVELLTTLFACAFHNLTAILLPFGDSSTEVVISMIRRSAADTVVTAPGAFPFDAVVKSYPALRQLIWVVDPGSSHMDWDEVPEGVGGTVNVATWQDVVNEAPAEAGRVLPPLEGQGDARDVTVFWQGKTGNSALEEMIRFTSANLIAGIAGQLQALPSPRRFGPEDLFLPADSLASTFTLTLTLAALYSNASVAFNSVAEKAADLTAATRGIAPTVIVATPSALLQTHEATTKTILSSFVARQVHWLQTRTLTQNGVMPLASLLTRYNDSLRPAAGSTPGKLRLIFTADRAGAGTPPLSSSVLSDLRIYTGARVLYALTAAKVAGAAVQTAFYDYRATDDGEGGWSHFGSPLPSTEVVLRDVAGHNNSERESRGEIVVRGPAVAGGEAALGVAGVIRADSTLAYA